MKLWTYCRLPPYFNYLHDETEFSCKQKKNSKLWLNTITETKLNIVHRNRLFYCFCSDKVCCCNSRSGSRFFWRTRTTSELHLLLFSITGATFILAVMFYCLSKSLYYLFSHFLSFLFLFSISDYLFWVFASILRSLSSNLSVSSSRSSSFLESSSPSRPASLTSCLVFDLYFFMRLVKLSLGLRAVSANSS